MTVTIASFSCCCCCTASKHADCCDGGEVNHWRQGGGSELLTKTRVRIVQCMYTDCHSSQPAYVHKLRTVFSTFVQVLDATDPMYDRRVRVPCFLIGTSTPRRSVAGLGAWRPASHYSHTSCQSGRDTPLAIIALYTVSRAVRYYTRSWLHVFIIHRFPYAERI